MQSCLNIIAGVLVGGRSSRMGTSKLLLQHPTAGTFGEHVVSVAREFTSDVVLLGSPTELPPALRAVPRLPDVRPNHGPLGGLCSLLIAANGRWALLLACDLPMISSSLIVQLTANATPDVDAVAFTETPSADLAKTPNTRWQACCALYHPRISPIAECELNSGRGSLQSVLRSVRLTALNPDDYQLRQLCNVNTPEELARYSDLC